MYLVDEKNVVRFQAGKYPSTVAGFSLALSVAYEGEFADVDAFNQPGVEAYKRIMGPRLAKVKKARAKKA